MGVRVIFKIVNFLMLALSLLNQANAQTVSAEKTEVFAGERIEVIWTHPSTDGFNKPSWSLCVKSVPTHLASTGALPTLDSYCIEDDYRYTVSGRGVYSFSKYLLPSMDVGHFVVAVVDKRENYRVYDHVNITLPRYQVCLERRLHPSRGQALASQDCLREHTSAINWRWDRQQ